MKVSSGAANGTTAAPDSGGLRLEGAEDAAPRSSFRGTRVLAADRFTHRDVHRYVAHGR